MSHILFLNLDVPYLGNTLLPAHFLVLTLQVSSSGKFSLSNLVWECH